MLLERRRTMRPERIYILHIISYYLCISTCVTWLAMFTPAPGAVSLRSPRLSPLRGFLEAKSPSRRDATPRGTRLDLVRYIGEPHFGPARTWRKKASIRVGVPESPRPVHSEKNRGGKKNKAKKHGTSLSFPKPARVSRSTCLKPPDPRNSKGHAEAPMQRFFLQHMGLLPAWVPWRAHAQLKNQHEPRSREDQGRGCLRLCNSFSRHSEANIGKR